MFFLGRARARLGDVAGAEKILTRAVEVAPSSVEAQMQLGALRLNQGRARAAQPCFRAALQAKPNLPEAWFNLGLSLGTDVINRAECIAAFREAIRLKPNLIEAYLGLAVALRAEDHSRTGAHPRKALRLHRKVQEHLLAALGESARRGGAVRQARKHGARDRLGPAGQPARGSELVAEVVDDDREPGLARGCVARSRSRRASRGPRGRRRSSGGGRRRR